jgi:hypothetical protein
MVGRPPISGEAMSAAELKRRQRALAKEKGMPNHDQMVVALAKAAIDECREHGMNDTLNKLSLTAARILEAKGFDRRRSSEALKHLLVAGGTK